MVKKIKKKDIEPELSLNQIIINHQEEVDQNLDEKFRNIFAAFKRMKAKQDDFIEKVGSHIEDGVRVYKQIEERMDSFEESLLCIMHNIKKNQFLYSHYPEDWIKNYESVGEGIKAGIKYENAFMDKKIKKRM